MDKQQLYAHHYQEQQAFYKQHRLDMFKTSDRYRMFVDIIKKYSPERFLDIGCSDGSFAAAVKDEAGCDVFGVDISEKAIHEAREKGVNGVLLDIDSEDLPFENDYFDCIFCGEVIEHVYDPDHLLGQLHRVLKPHGFLLLTTPNMAAWFNRVTLLFGFQPMFSDVSLRYSCGHILRVEPMGHLRLYTLRALKRLINLYNFKIVKVRGIGINYKIGFGKAHAFIARIANLIFKSPSWNSGILIIATKL